MSIEFEEKEMWMTMYKIIRGFIFEDNEAEM